MGYNLNFLSNNVNGLNLSKKRLKMFEYFRKKIANNGILFLQETYSFQDKDFKAVVKDFNSGVLRSTKNITRTGFKLSVSQS